MKEIPYGFCHCGCGQKTVICKRNRPEHGYKKGDSVRFIHGHHARGDNHYNWNGGRRIDKDGYILIWCPDNPQANTEGYVREHILIAEKVLGKSLPLGAVMHHTDGNPANNERTNLVVCQDNAYHHFLHQRKRAFEACGHANWRKCKHCHQYDDPVNIVVSSDNQSFHRDCNNKAQKEQRMRRKQKEFA